MIIDVTPDGTVALRDADDFRSFKIVASSPRELGSLAGLATVAADGKTAWVSQAAVLRLHASASDEWKASFAKMLDSVRRFGWVNDQDATVRAHIELAAP